MSSNQREKILKIIKISGKTREEVANLLGITRQGLHKILKKDPIDPLFIELFETKMGTKVDKMETKKPDYDNQAEIEEYKKEIDRLKSIIISLQEQLLIQMNKKK